MSARTCSSEEAIKALDYLRHAFGGYPIPDTEQRAHLRAFRTFTVDELRKAIDGLVHVADRRPSPNEIAQRVRINRRAAQTTASAEPWPSVDPDDVKRHLDAIRTKVPAIAGPRRRQA